MAGINKLKSGKWRVQIRRHGVYTSKTFNLKSDADLWARETERRIDRGCSGSATVRHFGFA